MKHKHPEKWKEFQTTGGNPPKKEDTAPAAPPPQAAAPPAPPEAPAPAPVVVDDQTPLAHVNSAIKGLDTRIADTRTEIQRLEGLASELKDLERQREALQQARQAFTGSSATAAGAAGGGES